MAPSSRLDLRATAVDLAAVLAVAVLLVGVHLLVPPALREGLALRYASPDPLHALTAAYVHFDDPHLRGNVAGYLAAGGFAYVLALFAGERRWFRLSFLAFLTVLPMAVGMTAATVVDGNVVGRGFSGVVAGLVGFVLVSPAVVLRRAYGYERWVGWNAVAAATIVVAAEILWVLTGSIPLRIGAVLAVGLVLTLGLLALPAADRSNWPADREAWLRLASAVAVTGSVLAVVSAFVVGLFPADVVGEDSVTNVLAHYLGLVYGAVVAAWGYRYWSVAPRDGAPGGERPGNRRS